MNFVQKIWLIQLPGFYDFSLLSGIKTWYEEESACSMTSCDERGHNIQTICNRSFEFQCTHTSVCSSVQLKLATFPCQRRPSGEMVMVNLSHTHLQISLVYLDIPEAKYGKDLSEFLVIPQTLSFSKKAILSC